MLCRYLPPSTPQCTKASLAVYKPGRRASVTAKCFAAPFPLRLFIEIYFHTASFPTQHIVSSPVTPDPAHANVFPEDLHEPGLSSSHRSPVSAASPCRVAASLPGRISARQYSASKLWSTGCDTYDRYFWVRILQGDVLAKSLGACDVSARRSRSLTEHWVK